MAQGGQAAATSTTPSPLSPPFLHPLEVARVWERELRAASGTEVCPFILTAGTWGNSRGKFHFYSSATWVLYYYYFF